MREPSATGGPRGLGEKGRVQHSMKRATSCVALSGPGDARRHSDCEAVGREGDRARIEIADRNGHGASRRKPEIRRSRAPQPPGCRPRPARCSHVTDTAAASLRRATGTSRRHDLTMPSRLETIGRWRPGWRGARKSFRKTVDRRPHGHFLQQLPPVRRSSSLKPVLCD